MAFDYKLIGQVKQAVAKQADAEQMRDKPQAEHLPPSMGGSTPPGGFFWRGADGRIYDLTDFSENKEIEQQFDKLFTSVPNLVKGRMGPSSGSKKDKKDKEDKKEEKSEKEAALSLHKLAAGRFFQRRRPAAPQQPAYFYTQPQAQPAPAPQYYQPPQAPVEQAAPAPAPEPTPAPAPDTSLRAFLPGNLVEGANTLDKQRSGVNSLAQLFGLGTPIQTFGDRPDQAVPGFEEPLGTGSMFGTPNTAQPAMTPSGFLSRIKELPSDLSHKIRLTQSDMKRNYLQGLMNRAAEETVGNYFGNSKADSSSKANRRFSAALQNPRFEGFTNEINRDALNKLIDRHEDATRDVYLGEMNKKIPKFDITRPITQGSNAFYYDYPNFTDRPNDLANQFSKKQLDDFSAPLKLLNPDVRSRMGFDARRALINQRQLDINKQLNDINNETRNKEQLGQMTGTGYDPFNDPSTQQKEKLFKELERLKARESELVNNRHIYHNEALGRPNIVEETQKAQDAKSFADQQEQARKNQQNLNESWNFYDALHNPYQSVDRSEETVDPYVMEQRRKQLAIPSRPAAMSPRDKARSLPEDMTAAQPSDPLALSNLTPKAKSVKAPSRVSGAVPGLDALQTPGEAASSASTDSDTGDMTVSPSSTAAPSAASMLAPNLSGTPLSMLAPSMLAADKARDKTVNIPEPVGPSSPGASVPGMTMNTEEVTLPSGEIPGMTMNQGNLPVPEALKQQPPKADKNVALSRLLPRVPEDPLSGKQESAGNANAPIQVIGRDNVFNEPAAQQAAAPAPKPEPTFLDEAKSLQPRINALREQYDMAARAGVTDEAFKIKRQADDLEAQQKEMRRVHYEDAKAKRENTQQDALASIRQRARDRGLVFNEPGTAPQGGAQFINADVGRPNPNARLAGEGAAPNAPAARPGAAPRRPYQRPPENTVVGAPRPDAGGPSIISSQFNSTPANSSGIGFGPDGRRTFTPPTQQSNIQGPGQPGQTGAKPNNFNPATGRLVGSRTNTASPNK